MRPHLAAGVAVVGASALIGSLVPPPLLNVEAPEISLAVVTGFTTAINAELAAVHAGIGLGAAPALSQSARPSGGRRAWTPRSPIGSPVSASA